MIEQQTVVSETLKKAPTAPPSSPPRSRMRALVSVALLALAGVVVYALIHKNPRGAQITVDQMPTPNIRTATVRQGNIGQYIEAIGTVTPRATVNLYSQVNGPVVAVHYVEGQIVHRGDPLIDIDPRPYEAQLQQYQGQLERDQALLKQAEIDLARYREARSVDAVPRQTFEDQEQTVEQYRGAVENDVGQVKYGEVQLSYCHIAAPISGRIGLRLVDPGNIVFSGSNSPIAVITQLQPITIVFNVAEDDLNQVRSELTHRHDLRVEAYDRSGLVRIATGKLLTLDNQVDTSTGTIRFRGQFENADLALFPNQFVNARLLVRTLRDQRLVPTAAVQHNGVQSFVYLVRDGAVHVQPITEIATEGDGAAVEGLQPGDNVAITGFDKIQDGTRVAILNNQPSSNSVPGAPANGAHVQ
jgi:membrane fusion protein, multidrug efflux system